MTLTDFLSIHPQQILGFYRANDKIINVIMFSSLANVFIFSQPFFFFKKRQTKSSVMRTCRRMTKDWKISLCKGGISRALRPTRYLSSGRPAVTLRQVPCANTRAALGSAEEALKGELGVGAAFCGGSHLWSSGNLQPHRRLYMRPFFYIFCHVH